MARMDNTSNALTDRASQTQDTNIVHLQLLVLLGQEATLFTRPGGESVADSVHCNGLRLPCSRQLHMDMVVYPKPWNSDFVLLG